jgi:uncharacterized linocin/CFP29 family protein
VFIDAMTGARLNDGAMVRNGQGFGDVGETAVRYEPGLMRPYREKGRDWCTVNVGKNDNGTTKYKAIPVEKLRQRGIQSPVFNAMTLTKDAWIELDRTVIRATRQRLRAWADLAASSTRGGFNAMGKTTLEYQTMNDPGEAVVDMDAMTDGRADRPLIGLRSIPLPITHSDFWFSEREIAVSRNSGAPLDTTMAEAAGRRVAEMIEKTVIGVETGIAFGPTSSSDTRYSGTSQVYGYTNFPYRVTKTDLNAPTGSNPEAVMTDVLEMIETMQSNGFFGPYMLYTSTGYSRYLSDDYFRTGSTSAVRSLRQRIMEIEGIQDIRRLDYLTSGYQLILVQMSSEVAQAINGMDITTVRWESQGGMRQNFKVMAVQVPLLKAPYNGISGILHATTA